MQKGFTLIELIVVIAIVTTLAAIISINVVELSKGKPSVKQDFSNSKFERFNK